MKDIQNKAFSGPINRKLLSAHSCSATTQTPRRQQGELIRTLMACGLDDRQNNTPASYSETCLFGNRHKKTTRQHQKLK
jgi:hypothetical protein